jgi:hypothetical protein
MKLLVITPHLEIQLIDLWSCYVYVYIFNKFKYLSPIREKDLTSGIISSFINFITFKIYN